MHQKKDERETTDYLPNGQRGTEANRKIRQYLVDKVDESSIIHKIARASDSCSAIDDSDQPTTAKKQLPDQHELRGNRSKKGMCETAAFNQMRSRIDQQQQRGGFFDPQSSVNSQVSSQTGYFKHFSSGTQPLNDGGERDFDDVFQRTAQGGFIDAHRLRFSGTKQMIKAGSGDAIDDTRSYKRYMPDNVSQFPHNAQYRSHFPGGQKGRKHSKNIYQPQYPQTQFPASSLQQFGGYSHHVRYGRVSDPYTPEDKPKELYKYRSNTKDRTSQLQQKVQKKLRMDSRQYRHQGVGQQDARGTESSEMQEHLTESDLQERRITSHWPQSRHERLKSRKDPYLKQKSSKNQRAHSRQEKEGSARISYIEKLSRTDNKRHVNQRQQSRWQGDHEQSASPRSSHSNYERDDIETPRDIYPKEPALKKRRGRNKGGHRRRASPENSKTDEDESGKGNLLSQIDLEPSSRYISGPESEEEDYDDEEDGEEEVSESAFLNQLAVEQQIEMQPEKTQGRPKDVSNDTSNSRQKQGRQRGESNCRSERGEGTKKKRRSVQHAQHYFEEDEMINQESAMNSIITCNVTEYGGRQKIYEERQKHRELQCGDMLIQDNESASQSHNPSQHIRLPNEIAEQESTAKSKQPVVKPELKTTSNLSITTSKSPPKKGGGGAFSDKMSRKSNDSRRSQYRNLSINVKHANAVQHSSTSAQPEGLSRRANSNANTGSLGTNGRAPNSLANTPSIQKQPQNKYLSSQQLSQQQQNNTSMPTKKQLQAQQQAKLVTNQVQLLAESSTAIDSKRKALTPAKMHLSAAQPSPLKLPGASEGSYQNMAIQAQNKLLLMQQQAMKRQKDLQDQAVSPFHKSQVSYSDYKQYKNYFEKDNKDGYFRNEQTQYYMNEYPKTIATMTKKPLPITKWQLGKMIGHGSFGDVYEGIDMQHGRQIAVKQVPISKIGNNEGTQQRKIRALKQEITLLSGLQHKNIVKFLGTYESSEYLNVFLEYVARGSLEAHYKEFDINEKCVSSYTKQILLGLEYLHYNNIIHRDIKAANILIRDDGTCQLADFGSSKKIIEKTQTATKSFCGTPYWMAPEVVKQAGHNRFADIWSLGCTVYEMIKKQPPWMDGQRKIRLFEVLHTIANTSKPPQYPSRISPALKDFLDCCFQQEQRARANVYELLRHPFITRDEFITPLAHLNRLQSINEQVSQISDASPFSYSRQHPRGFFFNKMDTEKGNKQFAQGIPMMQHSPHLQYNDVSPYSGISSKTHGGDLAHNKDQQQFQFKADNRNNATMVVDTDERQVAYIPKSEKFPGFQRSQKSTQKSKSKSNSRSGVTSSRLSNHLQTGSSRQSSEEKRSFSIATTSNAHKSNQQNRSTNRSNSNEEEHVVKKRSGKFKYFAVIQEGDEPDARHTSSNEDNANFNQPRQQPQLQAQPISAQNSRTKLVPETGDSEHENNDEKAKRSLNVDSAGGGTPQYAYMGLDLNQSNNNSDENFNSAKFAAEMSSSVSNEQSREMTLSDMQQEEKSAFVPQRKESGYIDSVIKEESKTAQKNIQPDEPVIEFSSNGFGSVHLDCMPADFGLSPIEPYKSKQQANNAVQKSHNQRSSYDFSRDGSTWAQKSGEQTNLYVEKSQHSFGGGLVDRATSLSSQSQSEFSSVKGVKGFGKHTQEQEHAMKQKEDEGISAPTVQWKPLQNSPLPLNKATAVKKKGSSKEQQILNFAERFHRSRGQMGQPTIQEDLLNSPVDFAMSVQNQQQVQEKPQTALQIPVGESDFGAYSGISGNSSLASQLNKLSLDNNLTDIEEDENEDHTARRDVSPKGTSEQASTNRQGGHLSLKIEEEPQKPVMHKQGRYDIDQTNNVAAAVLGGGDAIHDQAQAPQQRDRLCSFSEQEPVLKAESESKSQPISASKKDALKRIEDEIINALAKAESAKKKEQENKSSSVGKQNGNSRMKKARRLMIPKIYVGNSNKLMNDVSDSSFESGLQQQQQKQTNLDSPVIMISPKSSSEKKADSSDKPQNQSARRILGLEGVVSHHSEEEEKKAASPIIVRDPEIEKQVLNAISEQINKKNNMSKIELQDDDSDESSSTYKSPEVDSEELAALGDENLV